MFSGVVGRSSQGSNCQEGRVAHQGVLGPPHRYRPSGPQEEGTGPEDGRGRSGREEGTGSREGKRREGGKKREAGEREVGEGR